jgi:hypothetical protein
MTSRSSIQHEKMHMYLSSKYICVHHIFARNLVHVMRLHCLVAHSLPYTKATKHKTRTYAAIGYPLSL